MEFIREKLTTGLINLAMQNTKQYLDEVVDIFQEFIEKFFDNMNLHLTHFLTLAGYWMGLIKMPNFKVFHPELIKFSLP